MGDKNPPQHFTFKSRLNGNTISAKQRLRKNSRGERYGTRYGIRIAFTIYRSIGERQIKTVPRLLKNNEHTQLPSELFDDLRIKKFLSAQTVSFIKKPCLANEIINRQELFATLDNI